MARKEKCLGKIDMVFQEKDMDIYIYIWIYINLGVRRMEKSPDVLGFDLGPV